jgi:hypothetical protein
MATKKSEAEGIIDTLDDLFVYLGASDQKFKIDHYSYPISKMGKDVVTSTSGSPYDNGMFGHWDVSAVWIRDGLFNAVSAHDIHWSKISQLLNYHLKQGTWFGGPKRSRGSSADFDSYSRFYYSQINPNGNVVLDYTSLMAYRGRGRYDLGTKYKIFDPKHTTKPDDHWLEDANQILLSFAASEPAYWLAKIKMEDCLPGLALMTDPIGIRELLRFRNIPEGKRRRDALLHWVADHWRKDRNDPETELYVRKHLRGAEKCTYKNYAIDVKASREDSIDELEAKREREAMRGKKPRPDRRPAVARLR